MMRHQNLSRNILLMACLACAVILQGCATIISGTKDTVEITSQPPGAVVRLESSGAEYVTPASFTVARRHKHTLLVSREGYHTERVTIGRSLNPWLFGNVIFGGVIGVVVDLVSGATFEPIPGKAHVEMTPLGPGETAQIRDWVPPGKRERIEEDDARVTEAVGGGAERAG